MTQQQLEDVMLFHLQNFSGEESLPPETIHETVLVISARGKKDPAKVYQDVIGWTIDNDGMEEKPWPVDWMKLSVKELAANLTEPPATQPVITAPIIIILLMMLLPFTSKSQLQVTIGASKSELRESAITVGITYLKSFDSIWKSKSHRWYGKNSTFSINPEVYMQTGSEDAFSSIAVKATGLLLKFKTTRVSGILTPNTGALFHAFPMSAGVETNNLFTSVNGILEAGWVPWYQAKQIDLPKIIKMTTIGAFLQVGYKQFIDSAANAKGGQLDESEEQPGDFLARAKGSFDIDTKTLIKVSNLDVGIVGAADVWFDMVNGATYYRIEGRGRFYLNKTQYIDFIYQKGSGAPNFNQGDQFGVGLTLRF